MSQYSQIKQELIETTHQLLHKGFLSATGGNISIRIPGENVFCITPSNYDYAKMNPEDVCILDFSLNPIEGDRNVITSYSIHYTKLYESIFK